MTETNAMVSPDTLYQRLGSAEGIAAIIDDVVAAHVENPVIKARFLPYLETPEKVKVIKKHFCDFLGMGCGGPEQYTGRDMVTTHRGMNINEMEFVAALDDILMVLDKHNIDPETKKEVLVMAYSLKGDILHV